MDPHGRDESYCLSATLACLDANGTVVATISYRLQGCEADDEQTAEAAAFNVDPAAN